MFKQSILPTINIIFSITVFAHGALASDLSFCQRAKDWASIPKSAFDNRNQLSFSNPGGYLNMGLCWWHSLFERSMLYLAVFKPELQKPNRDQAKKIISNLVRQDRVVEIPGYQNIAAFSLDWKNEIESALSQWQILDGAVRQKWVQNLSQKPWATPAELLKKMQVLEKEVNQYHRIPWAMVKMPGAAAHAWLILEVDVKSTGYELRYVDSNFSGEVRDAWYSFGTQSISSDYYGNITLTLGYSEFYSKAENAIQNYCK